MVNKKQVSEAEIHELIKHLIKGINKAKEEGFCFNRIIGIERGGLPLAKTLSDLYNIPMSSVKISYYIGDSKQDTPVIDFYGITFSLEDSVLIVDDLVDTGGTISTLQRALAELCIKSKVAVLYQKPQSTVKPDFFAETTEDWIIFPWENEEN